MGINFPLMSHPAPRLASVRVALLSSLFAFSTVWSATIPASWDFGSDPGKDDLTGFSTSTAVTLRPDAIRLAATVSGENRYALTEFTNLGGASTETFTASTTIIPVAGWANDFARGGVMVLVAGTDNVDTGIFAGLHGTGSSNTNIELRIRAGGLNGTTLAQQTLTFGNASAITGQTFSVVLTGVYEGANLNLTLTAFGPEDFEQSVTASVLAASHTGSFAGVGVRSTGTTTSADFLDLAIIPEPSAFAALAGLGAFALVALRRRR